jgi:DNA polymerase elongation subunit (family B)
MGDTSISQESLKSLQFQIIDLNSDDVPDPDCDPDDKTKLFLITIYGKTIEGKNVVCNVRGFQPFFYLRVPNKWTDNCTKKFLEYVYMLYSHHNSGWNIWNGDYNKETLEIISSYNFYGFNYNSEYNQTDKFRFAKISFSCYQDLQRCTKAIDEIYKMNKPFIKDNIYIEAPKKKKSNNSGGKYRFVKDKKFLDWFTIENNCDCIANMYESKLHPLLRFIHINDIQPCGWIRVSIPKSSSIVSEEDRIFNADYQLDNIYCKDVSPIKESMGSAKFITASFDIECDSSHGDFPNPIKDCKTLAIDIYETYFRQSHQLSTHTIKICFIKQCIYEGFNGGSQDIQPIYTSNGIYSDKSLDIILQEFTENFFKEFDVSKDKSNTRDKMITTLTNHLNKLQVLVSEENGKKLFEPVHIKGDPIIQIGTVFHKYGDDSCYNRSILVIGNEDKPQEKICDDIENVNVYECSNEKELLLQWKNLMLFHNPDIVTGYNIFGFDFEYIAKRVDYLFPCSSSCKKSYCHYSCPKNDFYRIGRLMRHKESDKVTSMETIVPEKKSSPYYNNYWEKRCKMMSKQLSSSGLGDNILKYIVMDGRVIFDIQKEIQKGHALDSYKLDDVSATFMKGTIYKKAIFPNRKSLLYTSTIGHLKMGDYVTIKLTTKYGELKYNNGKKYEVIQIGKKNNTIMIDGIVNVKSYGSDLIQYEWCLSKDDVSPQQIFDYHKHGGSKGRALIAKYCIMDCELCIHLLSLLDIIPNNMGMANVSNVPLSYIFLRGQGIKIMSLVTKECSLKNTRIPTLFIKNDAENDQGFEGAIVLEPTPGIYEDPVSVLDYASLYPQSIREKNMSHETFIGTEEEIQSQPHKYKWLDTIPHHKITYDDYIYETKGKTTHKLKADTQTTCYFAKETHKKGIIPIILEQLLTQRKETRKLIKMTDDVAKQKVLDGLQLAYKVTANSVYGQMGARTSSIFFKKIAACTTSVGRQRIYDAKDGVVEWAQANNYNIPEVVYGDTDSVFVKFSKKHHETGEILQGKEALQYCIDCGIKAGEWITKHKLTHPQDLEYEKTFYPFILISKKRYTGDKYEYKADVLKERTSMGIVMKRRDNAPIVKYVFGNVIERIMNLKDIDIAIKWLQETLQKIIDGKMDESMFIISKRLSGYYKNPQGIAHKVLADRMAERNPGNKPKPNDRIPYAYIPVEEKEFVGYHMISKKVENGHFKNGNVKFKTIKERGEKKYRKKKVLQGDRIEHPDYIKEKGLSIDYRFYITNQIMNPVKQVLDLDKSPEETQKLFEPFIM